MIYGGRDAQVRGTKTGTNAAGEACLVAYAKERAANINDMLDKAKGSIAMMLCQAKKADPTLTLPASVGEQLDLKAALESAFSGKGPATIETAILERLEDDADGNPVFRSTVKMAFDDNSRTVVLAHVPSLTDPEGYYGSMTILHSGRGEDDKIGVMTVAYAKSQQSDGSYRMNAELRRARFAPELVETAIGSDGQIDFNAHRNFDVDEDDPNYGRAKKSDGTYYQHNADVNAQTLITFQVNPDTDEGSFTYWQNPGANYSEAARGMIAEVALVDGVKKGCATSGAALDKDNIGRGYSISSSIKSSITLQPTGFYHPFLSEPGCTLVSETIDGEIKNSCTKNGALLEWYAPNIADTDIATEFATDQRGGIVTRQCYKYDDTAGMYVIDTDEISESAGYELFRNTVLGKFIQPPELDGLKPMDGDQVKPE